MPSERKVFIYNIPSYISIFPPVRNIEVVLITTCYNLNLICEDLIKDLIRSSCMNRTCHNDCRGISFFLNNIPGEIRVVCVLVHGYLPLN